MKKPVILLENFSVTYNNNKLLVLENISFGIFEGEAVAILGPSGCGKTTLLNAISGLIEGAEITGEIKIAKNKKIRMVFQEPRLLPWSNILNNVGFGLKAEGVKKEDATKKAQKVLEIIDLKKYSDYYPSKISIGMKQRVNFARAIVTKPNILLLDEPFSSLDPKTKKQLEEEFLGIIKKTKMTAVFVTHNKEEAKTLADRVIVLSDKPSKVKAIYTKSEFTKKSKNILGLYR